MPFVEPKKSSSHNKDRPPNVTKTDSQGKIRTKH